MQDQAQELLHYTHNKYELVLTVARRAKTIKDDTSSLSSPEASKPIKMALRELSELQRREREGAL
ncbi:MAG TPA: DNA-directed RNA polymerase subunit omega [Oscillatoriaceae cyanobacterium]